MGAIDFKYVIIRFQDHIDFQWAWSKVKWVIRGVSMRTFRWTPFFSPGHNPHLTPMWIGFPRLKPHLTNLRAFKAISNLLGKFIYTDRDVM